jgi:hypothetical protein
MPKEQPLFVGEVSVNFADRKMSRSQRGGSSTAVFWTF